MISQNSQGTLFADINSAVKKGDTNTNTFNITNGGGSRVSSKTWGKKLGSTGEFSNKNLKNKLSSYSRGIPDFYTSNESPVKPNVHSGMGLAEKNQGINQFSPPKAKNNDFEDYEDEDCCDIVFSDEEVTGLSDKYGAKNGRNRPHK